jgi:hypothetical protein
MLKAGFFCLGTSGLTGVVMTASIKPYTPGNILPFTFWTLFLALGMALISPALTRLFSRLPLLLSYGFAIILGGTIGFIFTLCLYSTIINPYFGTFSIPVIFAWVLGGISGLITVAGMSSRSRKGSTYVEAVVVIVLCLIVGFMSNKLVLQITGERQVDTLWIRWFPSENTLILDPNLSKFLPQTELTRLQNLHLKGYLQWFMGKIDTFDQNRVSTSHMIVIMQKQIMNPVELPLPADEDVVLIYIQDKDEWRMDPPDAALLEQSLRLEVNPNRTSQVIAVIKVTGGTDRFGAIDWSFPTPNALK